MAKLSTQEAKEILKNPLNSQLINRGRKYESNLRLFTEPLFKEELTNEQAWKEYLNFLDQVLSDSKYNRITQFIQYPLSINDITDSMMSELYKVFDAKNSFFKNEFPKDSQREAIEQILQKINIRNWVEEKGKEVLRNKPNSVVVVDKTKEGEPFLLLVETVDIIDIEVNKDGQCEYIAFIHSFIMVNGQQKRLISFYDDDRYRVFLEKENGTFVIHENINVKHGLGYCPAHSFIEKPLNSQNFFTRQSPLGNSLPKLSEWQIFDLYQFYTDHYAPFPVIETPEENCSVDGCNGGVETYQQEYFDGHGERLYREAQRNCIVCANKGIIGPGTVFEIQNKQDKDDVDESGIFRMISPEVESLEYIKKKLVGIENGINLRVVGKNEIIGKEALNEDQVKGSFETKATVLLNIKSSLDIIHKWIVITVAKLVNPLSEIIPVVNYGTEWFILTVEQLQEQFDLAKKAGMPPVILEMIFNEIIETKYKGNPESISRIDIITMLDPMPFDSLEDKILKEEKGIVSQDDLILSENMITFVNRLERENTSLIDFGKGTELDKRIKKIQEIFKKYINERSENNDPEPPK